MQILRVAFGGQQSVGQLVLRIGEDDLFAAFRRDVHACGDHVEAPGAQARNQRAPLGQHAIDLLDAHFREDDFGDFRRFTGDPAIGLGKGERGFVGVADTDAAVFGDGFQRRGGVGAGGQTEHRTSHEQVTQHIGTAGKGIAHR
ncbi:hypothetical protein D3C81_454240 [compost metagenome]